jgi:hypothetical protein
LFGKNLDLPSFDEVTYSRYSAGTVANGIDARKMLFKASLGQSLRWKLFFCPKNDGPALAHNFAIWPDYIFPVSSNPHRILSSQKYTACLVTLPSQRTSLARCSLPQANISLTSLLAQ